MYMDYIMSLKDIISTVFLCLDLFHVTVCQTEPCKLFEESGVRNFCGELEIERGRVCYTRIYASGSYYWKATVTCHIGFDEAKCSSVTCYAGYTYKYVWSEGMEHCHCEPDGQPKDDIPPDDASSPSIVVYTLVPIIILLLGLAISFVFIRVYRKRRLSSSLSPHRLNNRVSSVTNRSYDVAPDVIGGNAYLYVDIAESDMNPDGPEESEYHTLHMDTHRNNNNNNNQTYHHIPVQPGTNNGSNVHLKTDGDTYSHLRDTNIDKEESGLKNSNDITDNVYNKLQIDTGSRMKELDSTSVDPDYDHTGACSDVSPGVELDTYAHLNARM